MTPARSTLAPMWAWFLAHCFKTSLFSSKRHLRSNNFNKRLRLRRTKKMRRNHQILLVMLRLLTLKLTSNQLPRTIDFSLSSGTSQHTSSNTTT
jgi:hypothetical protein